MGRTGRNAVFEMLPSVKDKYGIDFTIANGENASGGLGMNRKGYEELSRAGVDFFTMGNHTFSKKEIISLFEEGENIVRPANFPANAPGDGSAVINIGSGIKIAVANLIGQVGIEAESTSPFEAALELSEKLSEKTPVIIVDFHAEATSEKEALGYFLDGKVSAVIGTHTHVQTADEKILPSGTGYITDAGRTGAYESVLGLDKDAAIARFTYAKGEKKPPFSVAKGKGQLCGVVLKINTETGKTEEIIRICLSEQ